MSTPDPDDADLLVVNTCAFIGEARQESIDTILELAEHKSDGARLVVTGCLAERYGDELAEAMPDVKLIPYPVTNPDLHLGDWWNNAAAFARRSIFPRARST